MSAPREAADRAAFPAGPNWEVPPAAMPNLYQLIWKGRRYRQCSRRPPAGPGVARLLPPPRAEYRHRIWVNPPGWGAFGTQRWPARDKGDERRPPRHRRSSAAL